MSEKRKEERDRLSKLLQARASLPFWQLLKQDVRRYQGWRGALTHFGFWFVVTYRVSYWMHTHRLDLVGKAIQVLAQIAGGCEISRKAAIGPGLGIFHPTGIFIGPYVCMGSGINVGPRTFVGSNMQEGDPDDYPVVLDFNAIAAGAVLMGDIIVREHCTIGPNTTVLTDVPAESTVLPAQNRIIRKLTPPSPGPAGQKEEAGLNNIAASARS
jgi:serine acetyltransferase